MLNGKPKALDLFCGAGGCSVGYARAGFEVEGVDIEHHPEYPFRLHVKDALEVLGDLDFLANYDLVHASPPCQAYTTMSNRWRGGNKKIEEHPELIPLVRQQLATWEGKTQRFWVLENVLGARRWMKPTIVLRGTMFRELNVKRPRLFETNFEILAPPELFKKKNPIGVYGKPDGRLLWKRNDGTWQRAAFSVQEAGLAMGIDWMTEFEDLAEAIPPDYTHWIGTYALEALEKKLRIPQQIPLF